jgi:hypothetical protein
MPVLQRIPAWILITTASALLAISWITTALAQDGGDGDEVDGVGAALPILIVVAVLGLLAMLAFQRFSTRSRD